MVEVWVKADVDCEPYTVGIERLALVTLRLVVENAWRDEVEPTDELLGKTLE